MDWQEICDRGIVNGGNLSRFEKLFTRAKGGEHLKVGFLGGSITQGSLASTPQKCYAYLVFSWLKERFGDAKWEYINAGIGATTSQFGAARVESDLLRHQPDIVFLEYSVNDTNNAFFQETFEAVVRKILAAESAPALFMFNNVQYNDGKNAEEVHNEIGRAYGLPIVTMKASIYEEIAAGRLAAAEITPDNLHPNDKGHRMVADVICNLLDKIFCAVSGETWNGKASGEAGHGKAGGKASGEEAGYFTLSTGGKILFTREADTALRPPVTKNRFIRSVRYQNPDFIHGDAEGAQLTLNGFTPDARPQEYGVADVFKNGWRAMEEGSSFELTLEASCISVQFCRTVKQPAPVAKAVIDGDEEHGVLLDANFDETWGDCCSLKDIAMGLPRGKHTLCITVTKKPEKPENDFYLVSVIAVV